MILPMPVCNCLTLVGIRILDGPITDELEAKALLFNIDYVQIFSASWGPHDDGATMEAPKQACKNALRKGVETVSHVTMLLYLEIKKCSPSASFKGSFQGFVYEFYDVLDFLMIRD